MSKPKKVYTQLGTILRSKDYPDTVYLQLKQSGTKDKPYGEVIFPITLANGKVLQSGQILSLFSVPKKLAAKVAKGEMTQAEADEKDYLRYEVCLAEEVNDSVKGGSTDDGGDINF